MNKCKNCLHPINNGFENCPNCSIPLNETNIKPSGSQIFQSENGDSYSFSKKITTLGRKGDFQFPDDLFMSRIHAEVFLENNFLFIVDHKSQNGVLVNGIRIAKKTKLHKKDIVQCGGTKFEVL